MFPQGDFTRISERRAETVFLTWIDRRSYSRLYRSKTPTLSSAARRERWSALSPDCLKGSLQVNISSIRTYLVLSVVSVFSIPLHAKTPDSFDAQLQWTLGLDADGKVTSLSPTDARFLPAMRKQVEPVVRTWHFTPGKVDGQPAPTETTLRVGVALESTNASQYHGRITFATTGSTYLHVVKPKYPQSAQHSRHEGAIMLLVEYDADGLVTSVRDVPDMGTAKVEPVLIDAAIEAVKHWTFRPETVAGRGVASSALAPICFKLRGDSCNWNTPRET